MIKLIEDPVARAGYLQYKQNQQKTRAKVRTKIRTLVNKYDKQELTKDLLVQKLTDYFNYWR